MTFRFKKEMTEDEALDWVQFYLGGLVMYRKLGTYMGLMFSPQHGVGSSCRRAFEATEHEFRKPLKLNPEDRI